MKKVLKLKKVVFAILAITMVYCTGTTAFAADNTNTISDENIQVIVGIDRAVEVPSNRSDESVSMSIDDVLKNSTITVNNSSSMEGTYESDEYDTGLPGYTYQIYFEWVAGINSSGDYIFSKIENAHITTYEDYFVICNTWAYSHYEISKNVYSISSDKKSITFTTTYDFEYIMLNDPLAHTYTSTETHCKKIVLNNII